MRRKRLSHFFVAVILCLCFVIFVILYSISKNTPDQQSSEPRVETVEVIKEVEVDRTPPYYKEIADSITDKEIEMLARLTYLEAGNQSMIGQRAVVEVVLNRVLSDKYPNTIETVIFQAEPIQFTPAHSIPSTTAKDEQYEAVRITLEELEPILDSDVLYFSTGQSRAKLYEKIGAHYFYY